MREGREGRGGDGRTGQGGEGGEVRGGRERGEPRDDCYTYSKGTTIVK